MIAIMCVAYSLVVGQLTFKLLSSATRVLFHGDPLIAVNGPTRSFGRTLTD